MYRNLNVPQYLLYPSNSWFSAGGCLRPDGYQHFLMRLAEQRQGGSPVGNAQLIAKHNVSWVLLALSIQILRSPKPGEILIGQGWDSGRKGVLARREASFHTPEGEPVFSAASFHTLIDLNSRKVCRDSSLYDHLFHPEGPVLFQASSRIPFTPGAGTLAGSRKVMPSWMDLMGHMNNTRYGEMLYDSLTPAQRDRLTALSGLELYFLHELRLNDTVNLYAEEQGSCIHISALHAQTAEPAFGARLIFSENENKN